MRYQILTPTRGHYDSLALILWLNLTKITFNSAIPKQGASVWSLRSHMQHSSAKTNKQLCYFGLGECQKCQNLGDLEPSKAKVAGTKWWLRWGRSDGISASQSPLPPSRWVVQVLGSSSSFRPRNTSLRLSVIIKYSLWPGSHTSIKS